jgi:MFS family permease
LHGRCLGRQSESASDKLGLSESILLAAIVAFLSGLVTGFLSLLLIRALMGIAEEDGFLPKARSLMIEASRPQRRGLDMGLVQATSFGQLGGVLALPIVVGWAQVFGWRTALRLTITPGLLLELWTWRAVRERPPASMRLQEDGGR